MFAFGRRYDLQTGLSPPRTSTSEIGAGDNGNAGNNPNQGSHHEVKNAKLYTDGLRPAAPPHSANFDLERISLESYTVWHDSVPT